jgi:hypothetical protein
LKRPIAKRLRDEGQLRTQGAKDERARRLLTKGEKSKQPKGIDPSLDVQGLTPAMYAGV